MWHCRRLSPALIAPSAAGPISGGRRGACAALALLLLAGCALSPRRPASPDSIEYSGRFAVSWRDNAGADAAVQRATGRFLLRVDGQRSELEVSSPLGQTLAVARIEPGSATLESADGRRFSAERPETLTEKAFGWPAPLSQLPRWLGALNAEAKTSAGSSASGPTQFSESGWLVSVEAAEPGSPRRLSMRWLAASNTAAPHEVELRLVVDETSAAR